MIEDSWITAIERVGFPIFAFILMFVFSWKALGKNTEALNKIEVALVALTSRVK